MCEGPEMAKLTRKNLMVDADAVRQLAAERGTSESQAVRDAVAAALRREVWGKQLMESIQELHDLGAFSDWEELFGDPVSAADKVAEPWPATYGAKKGRSQRTSTAMTRKATAGGPTPSP
jgi:hypothetical protein